MPRLYHVANLLSIVLINYIGCIQSGKYIVKSMQDTNEKRANNKGGAV